MIKKYYILAFNLESSEEEQKVLKRWNNKFKPLTGSYKGELERSYLVYMSQAKALMLANMYKQESILELDDLHPILGRKARLIFTQYENKVELGYFSGISKKEALNQEAWTYSPELNQYFTCKGV